MGKSSKAKKRKQADFQKVKLKAGRKIPKGHVTDTNFRAGKLMLAEQMKEKSGDQPLTHRKLALQDLLNQLRHHSAKTRIDALHGLQELWRAHPAELRRSMFQLAPAVFGLIPDCDSGVRKAVQGLLKEMLSGMSSSEFSPNFQLLVAYIGCGLTHNNPEVKRLAMTLILETLVPFHGDLICKDADLIESILSIVPGSGNIVGKTLVENQANQQKLTSLTLRGLLIQLLGRLAKPILRNPHLEVGTSGGFYGGETAKNSFSDRVALEIYDNGPPFLVPFIVGSDSSGKAGKGVPLNEISGTTDSMVTKYFQKVIPFAIEFWVEISRMDGDFEIVDSANLSYEKWELEAMRIVLGILIDFLGNCSKVSQNHREDGNCIGGFDDIVNRFVMKKYEHRFLNMFPVSTKSSLKSNEKVRHNLKSKKASGVVQIFGNSAVENPSAVVNLLLVRLNALLLQHGFCENFEKHAKFLRNYFLKFAHKSTWDVLSQGLETAEIVAFAHQPRLPIGQNLSHDLWAEVLRFCGKMDGKFSAKSQLTAFVCSISCKRLNGHLLDSVGREVWYKFVEDLCAILPILASELNQSCLVEICAFFKQLLLIDAPSAQPVLLARIAPLLDSLAELSLNAEEAQMRDWFGLIYRLFPLNLAAVKSVVEILTDRSSDKYANMQIRLVQVIFTWIREDLQPRMLYDDTIAENATDIAEEQLLIMLRLVLSVILGPNRAAAAALLASSNQQYLSQNDGYVIEMDEQESMDLNVTDRILIAIASELRLGGSEMKRMGIAIVKRLLEVIRQTRMLPFSIAFSISRFLSNFEASVIAGVGDVNSVSQLKEGLRASLKLRETDDGNV